MPQGKKGPRFSGPTSVLRIQIWEEGIEKKGRGAVVSCVVRMSWLAGGERGKLPVAGQPAGVLCTAR